jgi:S-adenosylmethionine:tRNA ribosyltransferase-isomerase
MRLSDFAYDLPESLIAQYPTAMRSASRLLCVDGDTGRLQDRRFVDLPELLEPGDLMVFNDTQVMPARLLGTKTTGGKVEILVERLLAPDRALAHLKASKSPRPGSEIRVGDAALWILGRDQDLFELQVADGDFDSIMASYGQVPLPPYIRRCAEEIDRERYQTVYAGSPGAVAAPTAGLHFDQDVLEQLRSKGVESAFVTLHVGAGTFQPVRCADLSEHRMHAEWVEVDAAVCAQALRVKRAGRRVVAVGTTSVRSLEAAAVAGSLRPFRGDTRLFITPGFEFRVVDALLTNFHLPESTLLMLVSALGGYDQVMVAYRHAVAARYRFFSYGDAMWVTRRRGASR